MSRIICIIGNKGGTGKTTLSHMLCQGLGLLGQRSACVLTDTSREPLSPDGRRYVTADARTPEALHKVVGKLRTMNGWIGVIDGGGNRADVDRMLGGLADIVILPFRDSHEDLRTVLADLEAFPHAYALPSQWPTNAWARDAADRSVAQMLGAHRNRLLHPVASLSASKLLLQKSIPDGLPSNVGNACRALARQVMEVVEIGDGAPHDPQTDEQAERATTPPPSVLPEGYASTAHH
ncbi:MAG: hypothetical protein PHI64_02425 [Zoogloea sp.]|uniref:nucleotide-binding protein n=1 Tax=Zoogloea sp. TaxID=49181 RepID=UPI0026399633|nr:hypothetical protein [Zoogloea sp.]MDD2987791.1 hypothetical protein [Zoogloea sp.]